MNYLTAIKAYSVPANDRELVAALFARFAMFFDAEITEWEAFELIEDFLNQNDLDMMNIETLAKLVKTTKFDPEYDKWC